MSRVSHPGHGDMETFWKKRATLKHATLTSVALNITSYWNCCRRLKHRITSTPSSPFSIEVVGMALQ